MLVGLDIGGTKIEGVALNNTDHNITARYRVATDKSSYDCFLNSVSNVIEKLKAHGDIDSLGIGCCGSVGLDGLMQGANIAVLNGRNFLEDLRNLFDHPVHIANDADCFALSEFSTGAAKHTNNSCVALIIGTGCGAGIILNGGLVTGLNNLGGELGHNPLPHFQPNQDGQVFTCYCGSKNCIESFVSGTGYSRTFSEKYFSASCEEIMQLYRDGNKQAIDHFELYCDQLARVCGSIVNMVDPEVIVLGGGMSNVNEIYPRVNAKLIQYTFSKQVRTQIVKNQNGDSSGVIGAALLPLKNM
ncbi:sugar kinase [Photobacterium gaetbulicola]|uniref:ROK family protein n=1 Tax=Photobacterium gaetbulicola Gung47 TaxID=658445 RepID=A0A0C5WWS3_9GAMM|nr:ROK family protein [Photobacterium gaetbulicola]AJR09479.1 ROK family protein [Photobacterium gaetbulicola Gung47]PSU14273.1 sugar kinase [Photobacterium gaetbulicola]